MVLIVDAKLTLSLHLAIVSTGKLSIPVLRHAVFQNGWSAHALKYVIKALTHTHNQMKAYRPEHHQVVTIYEFFDVELEQSVNIKPANSAVWTNMIGILPMP